MQDGKLIKVTGVEDAKPNQGRLCVKGRFGYDFIYSKDRLKTSLIRENGSFREASWDEALDLVADKIKEVIKTSGPDALAGVSCVRSINEDYPFVLSTGRRLYHYHTRTQTGRCEGLNDLLGEETADISIDDAQFLKISHGEMIKVKSRRGEVLVKANVKPEVPRGMVWMAFHFRENNANWLTNPAFDPVTMTAEYKACSVRIEKQTL